MFVGLARIDLRLPDCGSLKDKRSVVRSVTATVRKHFNASVAEVDHRDLRQRATLGVSVVAETSFAARRALHQVERRIRAEPRIEVLSAATDVVGADDV